MPDREAASPRFARMRVLIALGGNAMTGSDGNAAAEAQQAAVAEAMTHVAGLVAAGHDVLLTHGNGPQVGNLLVKNELSASVVPPVPLHWCGAQTQATIGFLIITALEHSLADLGIDRKVATVVTRTLVDGDDPGFTEPTKPIGRFLPQQEAARFIAMGQTWADRGPKGWRRLVASPEPLEILDAPAIAALADAGFLVVGAGGGGIPVTRDADGTLHGAEAVIDKDLAAVVLGRTVEAEVLVIATDVEAAIKGFGTPDASPIGRVTPQEMRGIAAEGHFTSGSMGPKVEAAVRFVEQGGRRAVITSLEQIAPGAHGEVGTVVEK